jgi:hypothetical protein
MSSVTNTLDSAKELPERIDIPKEEMFLDLLNYFPVEIIQHTTSFLDSSSFLSLSLSNKEWNNICFHHETFWKNLFQSTGNSTKSNQQTWRQSYFHYIKYLKKLSKERNTVEMGLYAPCSVSSYCEYLEADFDQISKISISLEPAFQNYRTFEYFVMKDLKIDKEYIRKSMFRYEKFLELTMKYPDTLLIPTQDIEMIWISHMLKPLDYSLDCKKYFKKIIPHTLRLNDYQISIKRKCFNETKQLWEKTFNFPYCMEEDAKDETEINFELSENKEFVHDIRDSSLYMVCENIHNVEVPLSFQFKFSLTEDEVLKDRDYFKTFRICIYPNDNISIVPYPTLIHTKRFDSDGIDPFLSSYFAFWDFLKMNKEDVSKYSPDYEIDVFWHTHMLHPQEYMKDCLNSFGFLLNHTSNAEKKVCHNDLIPKFEDLGFEL